MPGYTPCIHRAKSRVVSIKYVLAASEKDQLENVDSSENGLNLTSFKAGIAYMEIEIYIRRKGYERGTACGSRIRTYVSY